MQTTNKNAAKKTATKNVANVTKINLDAFASKLQNIEVKEKSKKEHVYIYPEHFTEKMISEIEGKKHRNKLRNTLKRHEANIFVYAKTQQFEKLESEIKSFEIFYKENYRINDYSLKSLSHSNNETKTGELSLMLEIIKDFKAQISGEKTEKKQTISKKK